MDTTNILKFQKRTKKSIRLLAFLKAKKGKEDELESILLNLIGPTLRESGNIAYVPHRSLESPDTFMFDEIWKNEKALKEHFKQTHMINFQEKIKPFLEKPLELRTYYEIQV